MKNLIKRILRKIFNICSMDTQNNVKDIKTKTDLLIQQVEYSKAATRVALQQTNYVYNLTYITPLQNEYSIPKRFNIKLYVPDFGIESVQTYFVTYNTFFM